mgnify:CR=1 FL=1
MGPNRMGEDGPVPFRTGRFFNVGAQWYFATRCLLYTSDAADEYQRGEIAGVGG